MTPRFVIFEAGPRSRRGQARRAQPGPAPPGGAGLGGHAGRAVAVRRLAGHAGERHCARRPAPRQRGWEVKPSLLLSMLDQYPEAFWLDSDIVLNGPIGHLLTGDADDVLVATEETAYGQAQGGTHRTVAWGLPVGRSLPVTVNTGVMRVTRRHVPSSRPGRGCLADPAFADASAASGSSVRSTCCPTRRC